MRDFLKFVLILLFFLPTILLGGNPPRPKRANGELPGWSLIDKSGVFPQSPPEFVVSQTSLHTGRHPTNLHRDPEFSQHPYIDDFQVNEEDYPTTFPQYNPSLDGINSWFIVTWYDERNGDPDIYAQIYGPDCKPRGGNFRVNDDLEAGPQYNPSVSCYSGGFIICWYDGRNGDFDIYAQRFDTSGVPLGVNFRVNDDPDSATQWSPRVACNYDGGFVVCWEDKREGQLPDIYAQRYDSTGTPIGANFKVNDDGGDQSHRYPDIASDSDGNTIIVWRDYRHGMYPTIYAQRYDSDGNPLGENFMVNEDIPNTTCWYPAVASASKGNFIVVWDTWRSGDYHIYGQEYDESSNPVGANFLISDDPGGSFQWWPSVSHAPDSDFVVSWIDTREGDYDIYAQLYLNYEPQDSNFRVADDTLQASQLYPSTLFMRSKFYIAWRDERNQNWDIYLREYTREGESYSGAIRVNDDETGASQWDPSISCNSRGDFGITWLDFRRSEYDVYAQFFLCDGTPLGPNCIVNDDTLSALQWAPSCAGGERFLIAWDDTRNGDWDIYAQLLDWDGIPIGHNFKVNDDYTGAEQGFSSTSSWIGGFCVVWWDKRNDIGDIYAQRYNSLGAPIGLNFRVNDESDGDQTFPFIAHSPYGDFCIVWMDPRDELYHYDIYAQRYDSSGAPIGSNFRVNDDAGGNDQYYPSVAFDSEGNFCISWADSRDGDLNVYAQIFDSDGIPVGTNERINFDVSESVQNRPSIAGLSNGFLVVWEDHRNGIHDTDVYTRIFGGAGVEKLDYRVNGDETHKFQGRPSVVLLDTLIYFAWQDNRIPGHGYDIFAKVCKLSEIGLTEIELPMLSGPMLYQNRPNPFQNKTQITYELLDTSNPVTLSIFTSSGEWVKDLVSGHPPPGRYLIEWRGTDWLGRPIPAGVYFCRLTIGDSSITKKLIYLK